MFERLISVLKKKGLKSIIPLKSTLSGRSKLFFKVLKIIFYSNISKSKSILLFRKFIFEFPLILFLFFLYWFMIFIFGFLN